MLQIPGSLAFVWINIRSLRSATDALMLMQFLFRLYNADTFIPGVG